jgi:hypothetical protein
VPSGAVTITRATELLIFVLVSASSESLRRVAMNSPPVRALPRL